MSLLFDRYRVVCAVLFSRLQLFPSHLCSLPFLLPFLLWPCLFLNHAPVLCVQIFMISSLTLFSTCQHFFIVLESHVYSWFFCCHAPYAPWSGLSPVWLVRSRRVHHDRKEFFLVSPSPPRSGKSLRLRFGLKSRSVSALVWKVAPSPSWSEGWRRLRDGLESSALSALVWKVAPSPPWSEG